MKIPQLQCIKLHDIFLNFQASGQLHQFQSYQEPIQPEGEAIEIIRSCKISSRKNKTTGHFSNIRHDIRSAAFNQKAY